MNSKIMISIAMATYNGEKYIKEQLDSIIEQTISEWELIICDDCSTDGTFTILEEYAEKNSRIKIYRNEKNLGFKKNFEKAISLCSGEYIALSDQDDIWLPEHLEVLVKNIKGKSASSGNAIMTDGNGCDLGFLLSDGDRYYYDGDDCEKIFRIMCGGNPFFGAISLYNAEKCIKFALPIPDRCVYHDLWFSLVACCLDGMNYTFEPLLKHRIHGKNESGTHHITLFKQIRAFFSFDYKKLSLGRIELCNALIERFPSMPEHQKKTVEYVRQFYTNRLSGRRLKAIYFMYKHYKRMYATKNYKQFLVRSIKILIAG